MLRTAWWREWISRNLLCLSVCKVLPEILALASLGGFPVTAQRSLIDATACLLRAFTVHCFWRGGWNGIATVHKACSIITGLPVPFLNWKTVCLNDTLHFSKLLHQKCWWDFFTKHYWLCWFSETSLVLSILLSAWPGTTVNLEPL